MNPAVLNNQFVQVALPIVLTIFIAAWLNSKGMGGVNRRIDDLRGDMNRRFDAVEVRLGRIETKLDDHETRITRVEERTSLVGRRNP